MTQALPASARVRFSFAQNRRRVALAALEFYPETNVVWDDARDYIFAHGNQRMKVSFSHGVDDGLSLVKVRMTVL